MCVVCNFSVEADVRLHMDYIVDVVHVACADRDDGRCAIPTDSRETGDISQCYSFILYRIQYKT